MINIDIAPDSVYECVERSHLSGNTQKYRIYLTAGSVKHDNSQIKDPFKNGITIHVKEMAIIANIIHFMDSKSTIALAWPSNQKYLIHEGNKIDHVHPLCFIWTIIQDPILKAKLKSFRDHSAFALKWDGFLGYSSFHNKGFGRNMEKFYNHRRAEEYLKEFEAFYRALNLKPEVLNPYVIRKDWKNFASALLDRSSFK